MKSLKIIIAVLCLCVVYVLPSQAQEKDRTDQVFRIVDDMPDYPGGDEALRKDIAAKVKYPEEARKKGISGKVFVTFVVDEKGKVVDPKIARGVDVALDKEALRVMTLLKTWDPGRQRGTSVKVQYTVPINFVLDKTPKVKEELKQ